MYKGKVAENANIDSEVMPKWRTSKSHVSFLQLIVRIKLTPKKKNCRSSRGWAGRTASCLKKWKKSSKSLIKKLKTTGSGTRQSPVVCGDDSDIEMAGEANSKDGYVPFIHAPGSSAPHAYNNVSYCFYTHSVICSFPSENDQPRYSFLQASLL